MNDKKSRRGFLKTAGLAGAAVAAAPHLLEGKNKPKKSKPIKGLELPRWKGFNLQYIYRNRGIHAPQEEHFQWLSDWRFDFVRIPLNYRAWLQYKPKRGERALTEDDVYNIDESTLELIDKMVEYGVKHNIHVNLCFHHAPGYIIGIGDWTGEPFRLFRDESAQNAFTYHWEMFAKRYKGIGKSQISFNLFNEAPWPYDNFNGEIYKPRLRIRKAKRELDAIRSVPKSFKPFSSLFCQSNLQNGLIAFFLKICTYCKSFKP